MKNIFAQSSKMGKAGVSVFRLSGPDSLSIINQLLKKQVILTPRKAYYKTIIHPISKELIDNSLVIYFKAPASFTGEDVVEFHTHGSIAISKLLTDAILSLGNVRIAEPGEFTKLAFLNGKFDLTAAEGIADLIDSETIMQHRQAIRQVDGGLDKFYQPLRSNLIKIMALLEAYVDFPDEDIPNAVKLDAVNIVEQVKKTLKQHLQDNRKGEILRNGIKLAIIGEPNVGKSSLMNFLLQREIAIVSDIAGTTRDVIEGHIDIGGFPIIIQDTAGIRESKDLIEKEGIRRAISSARTADIKIIVLSAENISKSEAFIKKLEAENLLNNAIIIVNKIDLIEHTNYNAQYLQISVLNNINLDILLQKIEEIAKNVADPGEEPQITRIRQRQNIIEALESLENFDIDNELVLAIEDIRLALRSLTSLVGKITVDDILDSIFSSFCIGK